MVLLRSSSTPLLDSLIEASSNHLESRRKIYSQTCQDSLSYNPPSSMRRTRSDENLLSIAKISPQPEPVEAKFPCGGMSRPWRNRSKPMAKLKSIPSFSFYEQKGKDEENADSSDHGEDEFSFPVMLSEDEKTDENREIRQMGLFGSFNGRNGVFPAPEKFDLCRNPTALFMANGLRTGQFPVMIGESAASTSEILQREKNYEKLIADDPCNSLILKNYAKFLYEIRRNYKKSEEMYCRAILTEPDDGKTVSEFARLRWTISGDYEAASRYFDLSVKLAPTNNHVLAAYASFLWETEGDGYHTV